MEEERAKVRVVRCPKCDKLLPELANFSVYRCGGCNATLQAKKQVPTSEASLEKSNGEVVRYLENVESSSENKGVIVSDASSEVNQKVDRVDFRKEEEKKLDLNKSPDSDSSLMATSEYRDAPKDLNTSRLDALPLKNETESRESKYRRSSKAPLDVPATDVEDSVKSKVDGQEAQKPFDSTSEYPKFQPRQARRDEDRERTSAFRRPVPYPDEGTSNYHQNTSKKRNLDNANSAEFPDQDRAELLRKLDELRDQLRRSCEVAEKTKERAPANRTPFSSNPRGRTGHGSWFPEGSSSLNRTSSRHSPYMNAHSMDIPNLYPAVHPHNGIPGYGEVFVPHSLGRAPFHPAGQYPHRPMNNSYSYGQFDPDPLISYHHDGFYHQPACSCLHCYNSHWPTIYGNQRSQYPVNNHGFYPVDGPSAFGPQSYNRREPNVPSHSHETRMRQRATNAKEGSSCRPVAGAAPFIACYSCSELLQLPEGFSGTDKSKHKLRCGSCSQLISFEFDGRRLIPAPIANITSENGNNCKEDMRGHMNGHPVNSYSGDFDSPGYEVHSADEKLVLPSFPVSSNEMMDKEYGFHLSESEKMEGISSSPSISEDVDSPDSLIRQKDVPSPTEFPLQAEGISRVSSLPLREHFGYPLSNQIVDGPGNGSRSRRSEQEKVLSVNSIFKQNSVKEIPVATEMDLPDDEYPNVDLSQDPWEVSNDENQPRAKNNKSGESFFAGLIKKSFIKDFSRSNQSAESGRCKFSVNGHPISDRLVKKAEKLAGPVHPGDYWYDYRAGFWGVIGHACLGIIPPFIEEFNYPMPKNCSGGNTGVLVNGRELHEKDLSLLASRGLPATEGHSYIIEISGKVWDEASGEELDSLGKLAPTIEKVKHGFGMRVPRLIA